MRSTTKLMKNWQFTGPDGKTAAVNLPHTWNNIDGQDGGNDYCAAPAPIQRSLRPPLMTLKRSRSGCSLRASTPAQGSR